MPCGRRRFPILSPRQAIKRLKPKPNTDKLPQSKGIKLTESTVVTDPVLTTSPLDAALARVEEAAANPDTNTRDGTKLKAGEALRHGELYILRIDGRRMNKRKTGALSTTDLTEGKATTPHTVMGSAVLYPSLLGDIPGVLSHAIRGPIVVAEGNWSVTHTTHPTANFSKGVFQIITQIDGATLKRVED